MRFTAAHPALVIPFLRFKTHWLSVTGLIVGSIAPDFAYFIPHYSFGKLSHSLKGLFIFDLPMALVLAILFHVFIREQTIQALPDYFRSRALAVKPLRIGSYLLRHGHIFAISALIGSFTHPFWDSFTHEHEFFVRNYKGFFLRPVSLGVITLPLSRVIQHASTFVGFALLLWHISTLPAASIKPRTWPAWIAYWLLVGFMGALFMLLQLPRSLELHSLEKLVIPFLTGNLLAVILLGILYKLKTLFRKV
ncbi:DUF4184 family protein [Pontibacter sp. H259]|uniref:DUF4184 family protein n=1 Tax=Pontibacter sp. H259 TaxID=3133421 RepID=UPI0030C41608